MPRVHRDPLIAGLVLPVPVGAAGNAVGMVPVFPGCPVAVAKGVQYPVFRYDLPADCLTRIKKHLVDADQVTKMDADTILLIGPCLSSPGKHAGNEPADGGRDMWLAVA